MKSLEVILLVLGGLVGIQVLAGKIGKPGAIFPGYVVFGLILGALMNDDSRLFLREAGQFGFILLLFLLGLEVNIPKVEESLTSLKLGAKWFCWQIPLLMLVAVVMGLPAGAAFVAALALAGVAVGMAHPLLHEYEERGGRGGRELLSWLVAMEVLSILTLAGSEALLKYGPSWEAGLKITLMVTVIVLLHRGAPVVGGGIRLILGQAMRWRVHGVLLLLLALCAASDRIGLSAPKAAFFLGLFTKTLSDSAGQDFIGKSLRPLAGDFLVPIFFVYLGSLVRMDAVFSSMLPWACLTVSLIVGWRVMVLRRKFAGRCGWDEGAIRTTLPNLSMVAVGVQALRQGGAPNQVIDWLLLSGLLLSVLPALWPAGASCEPVVEACEPAPGDSPRE